MSELEKTQTVPKTAREEIGERLGALVRDVRQRRKPIEMTWLHNHAAWKGVRQDERQMYQSDTFRHMLPVARRAVERTTTRVVQMLMPSPKFFDVFPGDEFDLLAGQRADSVRVFHTYLLDQRIPMRRLLAQLTRSLLIYQRAIIKTDVRVLDVPIDWAGTRGRISEVWPNARAVDPFAFYVWPETVTDLSEAVLVFEDLMVPLQEYEQFVRRGVALKIERRELGKPEWPHHHQARLAHAGLGDPTSAGRTVDDGVTNLRAGGSNELFVSLSEVWFKSEGRWMQAWLVWNVANGPRLVRIHRAPYPEPPYRLALARPLPGEHYTTGMMDDLEPLNVLFNDQVNQGEEARAIASTPPQGVDATRVSRKDSLVYGPRKVWLMDDPTAVKVVDIPDTSASAVRAQQMTLALMNSIGGTNPATEGQPARGLPRAGFAVTSLLSLAMADTKDIAEILEQEILTPMLRDLHRLTVAFVPPQQVIRIPGSQNFPPRAMTPADLAGNWQFQWVGSLQTQDLATRAARMMGAVKPLLALEPRLNMQGYQVNWPALVKILWRDGLGERGLEQVVTPIPPQQQAQMMAMATTQPGAGGQPAGDSERALARALAGMAGGEIAA